MLHKLNIIKFIPIKYARLKGGLMKPLVRVKLISKLNTVIQDRMDENEIFEYLKAAGCKHNGSFSYDMTLDENIRWILNKSSNEKLLEIADELEVDRESIRKTESNLWQPGYFRLFLSHVSDFKIHVAQLQRELRYYGISSFVAHEDIKPTTEWAIELENSLLSMDALAAILTDGFDKSRWTDHEVGAAIGRQLLIIPLKRDLVPYGFMGKVQALPVSGKPPSLIAKEIFNILISHSKTRLKILDIITTLFCNSTSIDDAKRYLDLLNEQKVIPTSALENIRIGAGANFLILSEVEILKGLNTLLKKHGINEAIEIPDLNFDSDEIPF